MKSDDLDTECAKSEQNVVIEVLLAQSVARQIISTLGLSCAWKPQRGTSGATVLIVKGAFVYFLALHLLGLPARPMLQHGVENRQELMHTCCQGDFFDFSRGEVVYPNSAANSHHLKTR